MEHSEQIAMLCEGDEKYGVGTVIRRIALCIPSIQYFCFVDGELAIDLRAMGENVCIIDRPRGFKVSGSFSTLVAIPIRLLEARKTAQIIQPIFKERGIKVVHTHWLSQQLVSGFLRKSGCKTVWHIHNNTSKERLFGVGQKLNHLLARWGSDRILAVSDFIADNCKDAVPVSVVRNCAESMFTIRPDWPDGPIRCVVAGRIHESKGHHVAIQAVLQIRRRGYDIRLDVLGGPLDNGPYAEYLKQLIADGEESTPDSADCIRLLGFQNDLRQRHPDYHFGLQCRIDPEPCSMWVCETLVDGLPLIATATGGTPELVVNNQTGLLVPPGDTLALSDAIESLVSDLEKIKAFRKAAWHRGQLGYLLQRFQAEMEDLYCAMVEDCK